MIEPDVIDALWEKIEDIAFITREQFARGLNDWDIEVVRGDEGIAFVTMTQGPEFHFESFGSGALITRAMIMARLNPIIARHGYVTTKTPKDMAPRQHRFNKAFGFRVVGEDDIFTHYRFDTCQ